LFTEEVQSMQINEELRAVIDRIAVDDAVISISLIGAAAEEDPLILNRLKDLDLLVVRRGDEPFTREVVDHNGLPMDVSYMSLQDLERIAQKDNHQWVRILAKSKGIYKRTADATPFFQRVRDMYFDGPDALTAEDINYCRFGLTHLFDDLNARADHEMEAEFLAGLFVLEALRTYFKINNAWIPRDKKLLKELFQTDLILYELVKSTLKEKKLKKRIGCCRDILHYILKPYGGPLEHWERGKYPL